MVQYKIIENTWVDEHGKTPIGSTHYTVIYKTKFLFWSYWKTVKHAVDDPNCSEVERIHGMTYKWELTKFNSLLEAKEFAENYGEKDIEANTWVDKVVHSNELK